MLVVAFAGHLSLFPRVADLDGFYHIGHAAAYLEGSVFDTSLPWATQSVIREYAADLWWGFHVLLTPLAGFDDPVVGIRVAAFALTLLLGLTTFQVMVRHGVTNAGWWAAGFLVAVPNIFFRYLMLRPHVLSLAASVALLSGLVRGRWWQVAALSGLIAWVHLNLFWVAPAIVAAYAVTHVPITIGSEPDPEDRSVAVGPAFAAVAAGTLAGWLLRPNPVATAALLNVQLVELFTLKATDQPITFATELQPIGLAELTRTSWLFLGAWIAAGAITLRAIASGIVAKLGRERATLLVASLLISVAFVCLATLAARRALEQWVAFGFLTLPIVSTFLAPVAVERRRVARISMVVVVMGYLAWGAWRHSVNVERVAFPGDTLAEAARFLESNSEPGEVVFHPRWDNFGPLLAHNRTNHYLGGMDPIFQFAYDRGTYWEFFYLSTDLNVDWTCDAFPCSDGVATDSYLAIRDDFGARWVLVEPRRNPRLAIELLNDGRYRLALETQREAVFEVLPDTAVGEGG